MKLTNPTDRPILATFVAQGERVEEDAVTVEIPAGESIDEDDFERASTLVEYGAVAQPDELDAARALWAEQNRGINSRTASASASEGEIVTRRQATVEVATGAVDGGPLKGEALKAAVAEANESGAGIDVKAPVEQRREALAAWQASRGTSTPAGEPDGAEDFVTVDGEVVLDDDDQPYRVEDVEKDEDGEVVIVDGRPVLREGDGTDVVNSGD